MEQKPNTSKHSSRTPIKRPKATNLSSTEKYMVINMYHHLKDTWPPEEQRFMKTDLTKKTAHLLGIGVATVYRIMSTYKKEGRAKSPIQTKKRSNISGKISEGDKEKIMKIFQDMCQKEPNISLNKLHKAIMNDESLPNLKRSSFYTLTKHMKFEFNKKSRISKSGKISKAKPNDRGIGSEVMKSVTPLLNLSYQFRS